MKLEKLDWDRLDPGEIPDNVILSHPLVNELAESIDPKKIEPELIQLFSVATVQRLGYILDCILNEVQLANRLWRVSQDLNQHFYRQPLSTGKKTIGHKTDPRWKIIINTEIEIDE